VARSLRRLTAGAAWPRLVPWCECDLCDPVRCRYGFVTGRSGFGEWRHPMGAMSRHFLGTELGVITQGVLGWPVVDLRPVREDGPACGGVFGICEFLIGRCGLWCPVASMRGRLGFETESPAGGFGRARVELLGRVRGAIRRGRFSLSLALPSLREGPVASPTSVDGPSPSFGDLSCV